MALCAAWPSLPFINATTDGSVTLHKKHSVRLGGAPIEITILLRICGAPLRCKGLSYVAVGTYKQFCVGLGEDSGALPIDPATTVYRHGAQCSPTDSDLRASIVYAFRCDDGGGLARLVSIHFERDSCEWRATIATASACTLGAAARADAGGSYALAPPPPRPQFGADDPFATLAPPPPPPPPAAPMGGVLLAVAVAAQALLLVVACVVHCRRDRPTPRWVAAAGGAARRLSLLPSRLVKRRLLCS